MMFQATQSTIQRFLDFISSSLDSSFVLTLGIDTVWRWVRDSEPSNGHFNCGFPKHPSTIPEKHSDDCNSFVGRFVNQYVKGTISPMGYSDLCVINVPVEESRLPSSFNVTRRAWQVKKVHFITQTVVLIRRSSGLVSPTCAMVVRSAPFCYGVGEQHRPETQPSFGIALLSQEISGLPTEPRRLSLRDAPERSQRSLRAECHSA